MRMVEWAFEQDIQHAEKLVLVYLAATASAEGVGMMDRTALMVATSYKLRSIQRLLQRLRANELLEDIGGPWYRIGNLDTSELTDTALGQLRETPSLDYKRPMTLQEIADEEGRGAPIDADAIGEAVAKHVIDAAEYHMDQLQNFEIRQAETMQRMALFHVEHNAAPAEPPSDPVVANPLYQQLIDGGMVHVRAYTLSKADLDMGDDLDNEEQPAIEDSDSYADDPGGRYCRILDILHGIDAFNYDTPALLASWAKIEAQQNKHTVDGETSAFEQMYPAIVAAAKANVGKMTIAEFLDPHIESRSGFNKPVTHGVYAWEQELAPVDKESPTLMAEIAVMLAELEATNDPRCEVQPQTKETGDDNVERTETVLGYHRRVTAKHREMERLKAMGVIG